MPYLETPSFSNKTAHYSLLFHFYHFASKKRYYISNYPVYIISNYHDGSNKLHRPGSDNGNGSNKLHRPESDNSYGSNKWHQLVSENYNGTNNLH